MPPAGEVAAALENYRIALMPSAAKPDFSPKDIRAHNIIGTWLQHEQPGANWIADTDLFRSSTAEFTKPLDKNSDVIFTPSESGLDSICQNLNTMALVQMLKVKGFNARSIRPVNCDFDSIAIDTSPETFDAKLAALNSEMLLKAEAKRHNVYSSLMARLRNPRSPEGNERG